MREFPFQASHCVYQNDTRHFKFLYDNIKPFSNFKYLKPTMYVSQYIIQEIMNQPIEQSKYQNAMNQKQENRRVFSGNLQSIKQVIIQSLDHFMFSQAHNQLIYQRHNNHLLSTIFNPKINQSVNNAIRNYQVNSVFSNQLQPAVEFKQPVQK